MARGQVAVLALLVDGGAHEVHHRHAGDFHRRLEGQEQSLVRPVFGRKGQQVLAVEGDRAARHFVGGMAHQHIAQRALARAVLSHQGVYLAVADGEVDAPQYLFAIDAGMEVFDL